MSRKTTLTIAAAVLFLFFLLLAGIEKGTHLFNFRYFQFQSSLFFVVVLFLSLGAFSMFVLFTFFPPRFRASMPPAITRVLMQPRRQSRIEQAQIHMEMGNASEALALLEQVGPGENDYSRARKIMGDLAVESANEEQAEYCYHQSLKSGVGSQRGPAMLALASLYETQNRLDAASELYREAVKAFPESPEPGFRLRSIAMENSEWEEALYWQSDLEERFADTLKSEEEDSIRAGVRYELAVSEFESGAPRNAQALLKNIFRMTDGFTPAYLLSGDILQKHENTAAAVKLWEKGFEATQNPVFLQRISEALLAENLPERAVENFQRIVRENPTPELEYCLAEFYLRLEMVREAQHIFERLQSQFPEWRLNSRTLADIYRKSGEYRKAAEIYSLLLDQDRQILPWICYKCNTTYERYRSRCASCRDWNTVQINSSEAAEMEMNVKDTARNF